MEHRVVQRCRSHAREAGGSAETALPGAFREMSFCAEKMLHVSFAVETVIRKRAGFTSKSPAKTLQRTSGRQGWPG